MRFSTQQPPFYGGSDLHARTMDVCSLDHKGASLVQRHMQAGPEPLLKPMAPSREARGVWVACLFPWYGLADRCARAGLACVLGQALAMKASHGGKAQHDTIAAQKSAGLLRGARLPQASGEPAQRRATRALRRRRMPRRRNRAARLTPIPPTHRPSHLPERGQKRADTANRDGVAARCAAPAGQQRLAGDRALLTPDAPRRNDVELTLGNTAKPQDTQPFYRLQAVPGSGTLWSRVLRYALQNIARCPGVPACVSAGRLVTGAKASAGQRYGTAGAQRGQASCQWACAAAAGLCLRDHPAGPPSLASRENKPGPGQA